MPRFAGRFLVVVLADFAAGLRRVVAGFFSPGFFVSGFLGAGAAKRTGSLIMVLFFIPEIHFLATGINANNKEVKITGRPSGAAIADYRYFLVLRVGA
ncbi:hypothetical protein C942_04865 [Photobacterium marinum]|uniref:Uncharacterized protein n=1 Tax=Photobacterium marinum TaxID=1056511 RepID=L8JFY9_9GAMM|nr:hypothetical protein C942_04865 [Photobacterium marinum]